VSRAPDPSRVVREGYDRLDGTYRAWVARMTNGPRAAFLGKVLDLTPPGAAILEVGCGPGTDARALADRRRYTGIDLSAVQLRHAREAVPQGTFILGHVLEVDLPAASFDAVVAFYVFGHIPAVRLKELLDRIAVWLRPGGLLCASFGTSDDPGSIERMWLGAVDMYFSSLPTEATERALEAAGYSILSAETLTEIEADEGPATFRWVIARHARGGRP
jgi:SAM-dependent methyltransferase